MKNAMRVLGALFAAATLAGCGGGGGGETAGPAPAPSPSPAPSAATPVRLQSGNGPPLIQAVMQGGETVLSVAQFVVDSVDRLDRPGAMSPITETCAGGGQLTLTLTDRDGNGTASAGDRVSVLVRDCLVPIVSAAISGSIEIELTSVAGLPAGSRRGTISLATGLTYGATAAGTSTMLGSMQFEGSSATTRETLRVVASPADDLRFSLVRFGATTVGAIREPDLSKTIKYDEAHSVITLSYRYESQAYLGSVIVGTPEPLQAYLDTQPDKGRVELTGAGGTRLTLTPSIDTAGNSSRYQIAVDSDGDGGNDAVTTVDWIETSTGFLWWGGTSAVGLSPPAFQVLPYFAYYFRAEAAFKWIDSSASVLRLQFSRPIASTAPSLYFRFKDNGTGTFENMPPVDVEANTERHGALFVIRPASPLRHARFYSLETSLDGTNWSLAVTLQDTLGNSTLSASWPGTSIVTPDNLRAIASANLQALFGAADQVLLDGRGSTTTQRPIAGYRWTQLTGTPLHFDTPNAAQTLVSWGQAPPTGIESALVELTVTDSAGDSDSVRIAIVSAELAGARHLLYYRSSAGDFIGSGLSAVVTESLGVFIDRQYGPGLLEMQFSGNASFMYSSLRLATADGAPFRVGAYENTVRFDLEVARNILDFGAASRGCNQTFGRFDVLEVQLDNAGNFTKFAVDFEQHCEQPTAPPLFGSYRLNSTIPLRR